MEKKLIFVEETGDVTSRIFDRIHPDFSAKKLAEYVERWRLKRRGFTK